jgi:hypothetical protein
MGKGKDIPATGHGSPLGPREVKALILIKQSANRWRQGCQPYAPFTIYTQVSLYLTFNGRSAPNGRAMSKVEMDEVQQLVHAGI